MKHVLLAVVGLSPQVVTEAIYALLHEGRPVDAIHLVTTGQGVGEIFRTLLAPTGSPLDDFCQQYGVDRQAITFGPDSIHVITRQDGKPIDDIESEDDNERLLEKCLELAHRFTTNRDTRVSFLVAGGRKTMTSCLTLAAQLYGRSCDRLYHVLVSPEFEGCSSFWFPPGESTVLTLTDPKGETFYKNTKYARVTLIPIPFVSIRSRLNPELLDRPRPPAELMQSLIRSGPKQLTVDIKSLAAIFGNGPNALQVDLNPAQLAIYAFFAERKTRCPKEHSCAGCTDCWLEVGEVIEEKRIVELYRSIPTARIADTVGEGSITQLTKESFRSYRAKINKALLRGFGGMAMHDLEIASYGTRPDTRYGLRLGKERIRIVGS